MPFYNYDAVTVNLFIEEKQKMGIEVLAKAEKSIGQAKSLKDAGKKVLVANVERSGVAITVPPDMPLDRAIEVLRDRIAYEGEKTSVVSMIHCFPWDGAVALYRVIERKYGWAQNVSTPDPVTGKPIPPAMIKVDTGPGESMSVPWGRYSLPQVDGWISTHGHFDGDLVIFALTAEVKRKDEATVTALFKEVEEEVKRNSIYRGRAIKIRFLDEDGDRIALPKPEFIDVEKIDEHSLVFSEDVLDAVQVNLFTPIQRVNEMLSNGIPLKRGVLLGGTYGTGKTMAASVASKYAVQQGLTYIYVPRANELRYALAFAQQYQSPAAVVFCEDIDRVTSGDRNVRMDDILNMLDGIDSKIANVMVVLTTNELNEMNPAMLRPGRLDAVIEVTPPNARAVEKLIRNYADGLVAPETDLTAVGDVLKGQIPAIIAEVVKRAKLAQLRDLGPGEPLREMTAHALLSAAKTMDAQMKLLKKLIEGEPRLPIDPLSVALAKVFRDTVEGGVPGKYENALSGHDEGFELRANGHERNVEVLTPDTVF